MLRGQNANNKAVQDHKEEPRMKKHDEARRAFLVGGAAAGAGAVAATALAPQAYAKSPERQEVAQAQHTAATHAAGAGHGAFFNDDDALTIAALAERIMPGAPGKPGATDAGVLNYIDHALAGAYADRQDFYRRGLAQLDEHCAKLYKTPFRRLSAQLQDETIAALEQNKAPAFKYPSAPAFFNTVRTHTLEGMFADPIYGGNKDFAGWRLVGFPGAQPLFTQADMESKQAFTREPIVGLQARATGATRRG
jgi:gluconate 2-dehydrogenase gamma chain